MTENPSSDENGKKGNIWIVLITSDTHFDKKVPSVFSGALLVFPTISGYVIKIASFWLKAISVPLGCIRCFCLMITSLITRRNSTAVSLP